MKGRNDEGLRLWLTSWGTALGLHAAAAVAMIYGVARDAKPPVGEPPAAMMVELAPAPSAPEVTPSNKPPEPPKPIVEKADILPIEKLPVRTAEVVVPQPEKKPTEDQPPPPAPPTVTAPPAPTAAAPKEGASNSLPSNADQTWEGQVLAKLERKKRYPGDAQRQGQEDVVYTRLVIDRTGRVLTASIVKSRSYAMLDAEVLDLAKRASPLPPPPDSVKGDPVSFVVPVEFSIRRNRR